MGDKEEQAGDELCKEGCGPVEVVVQRRGEGWHSVARREAEREM
jgi:hypothetical protein